MGVFKFTKQVDRTRWNLMCDVWGDRRAIKEALSKGGSSADEELQLIVVSKSDGGEGNGGSKGPSTAHNGLNSESSSRRSTATERQG